MKKRFLAVLVAVVLFITGCGAGQTKKINKAENRRGFSVSFSDRWEHNPEVDDEFILLVSKQDNTRARISVRLVSDAKETAWDNLIKPYTGMGWSVFLLNRRDDGPERWHKYKAAPGEMSSGQPLYGYIVVKRAGQSRLVLNLESDLPVNTELYNEFAEIVKSAKNS